MFKTRLLSGIVLVIAALVLIITGGDVLLISTLIISYNYIAFFTLKKRRLESLVIWQRPCIIVI